MAELKRVPLVLSIFFDKNGEPNHNFNDREPLLGDPETLRKFDVIKLPELMLGNELPGDMSACHHRVVLQERSDPKRQGDSVMIWSASIVYMKDGKPTEKSERLKELIETKKWAPEDDGVVVARVPSRGAVFLLHTLTKQLET